MKNLTINNQFLSTSEFLIPNSTGEYLPTNISIIYAATDAEEISEELTPENISDNLPTEIQNQVRELGDSYYTIAIIPQEKVSDYSNKLKAYLKEILDKIIKQRSISDYYLYDIIPDLFQNLAALQDINQSLELADIISLIKEIDKFSKESISSMILF